ncbi:MAG: hypothetical protein ACYDDP_06610 [Acidithiobacillus sp.]
MAMSKLVGFSALLLILVRWVLDGGYFNIRIHKYDTKINIATKLMENEKFSKQKDVDRICNEIVQGSLFGIEYICDCNGTQLLTLKNMIANGLTKRGVKIASKMIDQTTGKLKKPGFVKYFIGLILFFGSILYFFISYSTFINILGDFYFYGYQLHPAGQVAENNAATSSYFLFFYIVISVFYFINTC